MLVDIIGVFEVLKYSEIKLMESRPDRNKMLCCPELTSGCGLLPIAIGKSR
jgi:hypothetical protein